VPQSSGSGAHRQIEVAAPLEKHPLRAVLLSARPRATLRRPADDAGLGLSVRVGVQCPALNVCEAAFLNCPAELHLIAGPPRRHHQLLRNDGGNANNWLMVKLVGTNAARDGTGAALKLVSEAFTQYQQAKGGMSYMLAHDLRIHFGLGQRKTIDSLEITWLSGTVDKLTNIPINQIITVKEGTGIMPGNFPSILGK
jgi:hypothetical protein